MCVSVHSFLLLCSIPLCGYTTVCPFYSSWAYGLFPSLDYYKKSAMNSLIHVFFSVGLHIQFCWVLPTSRILGHRAYVCLTLAGMNKHFSIVVGTIYISIINAKVSVAPHPPHTHACMELLSFLILVIPVDVVVVSHCGFNFHFFNN